MPSTHVRLLVILSYLPLITGKSLRQSVQDSQNNITCTCRKTKVAILGVGVAGIMAAKELTANNITDFLIVETNDRIGGRIRSHSFGHNPKTGLPYTIELGANWVHGTHVPSANTPENPVWALAQAANLSSAPTNFSSIRYYNDSGPIESSQLDALLRDVDRLSEALAGAGRDAGRMNSEAIKDQSLREGLRKHGWDPKGDPIKQALEWYEVDYELGQSAEESSQLYSMAAFNSTQSSSPTSNAFITSQSPHGFSTILTHLAATFLSTTSSPSHSSTRHTVNDTRLLLSHRVTHIDSSPTSVTIYSKSTTGSTSCIEAKQVITTFSLGVLQHRSCSSSSSSSGLVFTPPLPDWKTDGIDTMQTSHYTKIFLQWPPTQIFWPPSPQFHLYASSSTSASAFSPTIIQSLAHPTIFPNSGILLLTVVGRAALQIESQPDALTLAQILEVLGRMFPGAAPIPSPSYFYYPRWSRTSWAYGAFSNVPLGMARGMRRDLGREVGRMWFAGEYTSLERFGYLQGAAEEGRRVGKEVAGRVLGGDECEDVQREMT
ncbi:amine oxidase [Lentithecium fluviatile CBS 122367]|uniref:Amine oxidase n=1 Tax=Lentithecium fluviatile CBS 122367 TaxID=1168545 RepID=A0A6G1JG85_9PLEO|nr:amine oxidase [Lentithecium fluviatile CBS 122367]